jgi:hypothetical protein
MIGNDFGLVALSCDNILSEENKRVIFNVL